MCPMPNDCTEMWALQIFNRKHDFQLTSVDSKATERSEEVM